MKYYAIGVALFLSIAAQAEVINTLTGINTADQSQCVIQIIKNGDETSVKVSATVKEESKVYGEKRSSLEKKELTLKSARMEERTNIYQKEISVLNIDDTGFTYKTKYIGRLYEGDFKESGKALLDVASGTFKYNFKATQRLKDHNGRMLVDLFMFLPNITSKETISCIDLK